MLCQSLHSLSIAVGAGVIMVMEAEKKVVWKVEGQVLCYGCRVGLKEDDIPVCMPIVII